MRRRDYLKLGAAVTGGGLLPLTAGGTAGAAAPAGAPEPAARRPAAARADITISDFEGQDWAGWTTTGTAFGSGPIHGAARLASMDVAAYFGDGVASSEGAGDGPTGTLTSPV